MSRDQRPAVVPALFPKAASSPTAPHARRTVCAGVVLLVGTSLLACGHGNSGGSRDPIPECQEYAALVEHCTGREAQVPLLAVNADGTPALDDASRARLRASCEVNTTRLRAACR
jgi:hypothetical protein